MKVGWEARSIATFAKTGAGGTPKKSTKAFYEGGDIPWLLSGEVANANIVEAKNFITAEGLKGSSAKLFPANSVLVAMYGATAGEVGVLRFEAATNQAVCAVLPSNQHIPEYLYYYLLHAKPSLVAQAVGNAQPNISQAKIKSLEIPLPPLEEQQRIVAVLDEAFEGLARARAHAEANLQNARELFSQSVERFISRFPDTRAMRLGDIVDRLTNGYVGPTRNIYVDDGIPYLLARHVRDNTLKFDGRTYVTHEFNEKHKKSKLLRGDVVLVQSGHIGHCAEIPEEHEGHNCHAMIVLSPKSEVLTGTYLAAIFSTPRMQDEFQRIRTGSTVPHLTCKMVKELKIPVMELSQQDEFLAQIRELRAHSNALIGSYEQSIRDIDDLRQSLLQKAFAGELT